MIYVNRRYAPLPTEDDAEDDPEELPALMVERIAEVQRLKQVDDGDIRRVERVGRVDKQLAEYTSNTISNHLARKNLEDSHSCVQMDIVEQVQCCDDLHGYSYRGRRRRHDHDRGMLYSGMS